MFNWLKDDIQGVMALPRHRKAIIVGFVLFAALVQTAMATSDVRMVGPLSVKPVTGSTTTVSVANFPATQPVSGSVAVSNFPATQPVSGPLTNAELRATPAGVQIYGSTGTGPGVAIPLDLVTNAPIVIDYEHHEVHSGSAYSFSTRADVNGNGTIYNVIMVTSDTAKWPHLRITFATEAEFDIELYEGTTYTGGASTTTFNRNRNSSKAADMQVILGATATGNGTLLRRSRSGSGTGSGGGGEEQEEWILKQNTVYNFRFTKQTNGTHYISYKLWWYEHTNKN